MTRRPRQSPEFFEQHGHEVFEFDSATGQFTYRSEVPRYLFANDHAHRIWHTKYPARPAGHVNANGYVVLRFGPHLMWAHRYSHFLAYGAWPEVTDHINGIRTDNRPENLRSVTPAENQRNLALRYNNTSGRTGVHWQKSVNKWCAAGTVTGVTTILGYFSDFADAVLARVEFERANGFSERHGQPLTARWVPAAANDDFGPHPLGAA